MKVSLNLLRTLSKFDQPVEELVELIGTRIGQVEVVTKLGPLYKGIVVAEIVEAKDHPDADKLGVYKVKLGSKQVQVVAGDKTLEVGDHVAYIPPGAVVPATANSDEPLVIQKRDLRGQTSNGMLASARELSFGQEHEGVLKLDAGKLGQPIADVYQLDDVIIDIENKVLTHRPDMFGHLGFARELSGVLGQTFTSPDWFAHPPTWPKPKQSLALKIAINEPKKVPRFTASVYSGMRVAASPIQLRTWLNRLGVRPLNNLIDLTNYLMLVTGQPLHAFDYDKVVKVGGGAELNARLARAGESLKLLDGQTIKLKSTDLVIAGKTVPLGLAGVMGGADTEVDDTTTNVIFEAANFDMYSIRNTSMRHGIFSEAVTRFARGQDPHSIPAAQGQVSAAMAKLGAKPASTLLDKFPQPRTRTTISMNSDRVNQLLGLQLTTADMTKRLAQVELTITKSSNHFNVTPPTWRPDLELPEDIVEEVGRLHGYNLIPPRQPNRSIATAEINQLDVLRRRAAGLLSAAGANEVLTYSGVSKDLLVAANQDSKHAYAIRNAISPDLHHMRLSLTPSLLSKVSPNLRRGFDKFVLFEIGTVHHKTLLEDGLPAEQPVLALVFAAGPKTAPAGAAFYQASKYLTHLLNRLGYSFNLSETLDAKDPWLVQAAAPYALNRRAGAMIDGQTIGVVGELAASTTRRLKLPKATSAYELNLGRLASIKPNHPAYHPLSRYPRVTADLTLKVPSGVTFAKLLGAIETARPKPPLELSIWPLGIYQTKPGHQNVTFRLDFVSHERTLKQYEVNELVNKLADTTKNLGAQIV